MTAFAISTGGVEYWDAKTGGSVNATLDTYAISNDSTLCIRTDTYCCPNHTVAFGSIDTVTFSGQGGTLKFDPTYVRVIAYTGGSGNSPAYGTTITSTGGATGVFLGAWTTWQSEPIVAGAAIGATGFIKVGGVVGTFAAGALTGVTATCSGADVQGWIEVRGSDTGTITVPRIGAVVSTEAWFELGTTTGARGQILPCPTTATVAGVFGGVWIETAAGSGVYEQFHGAGSMVALSTTPTDARAKFVWQTTAGIRIGNDGTNAVGFLPPTGCKVRIPAAILTNCTRTASGSGPRVLPNTNIATRQELATTGAGYFDLRNVVCQWYMNFSQAFYVKYLNCVLNDSMILSEIASPLDVDNVIVAPTQAQINYALAATSCFAGGEIKNSTFVSFSLAASGRYIHNLGYLAGVTFTNVTSKSLTLRANATTGAYNNTQLVRCIFNSCTNINAGRMLFTGAQGCEINNLAYADSHVATSTANPMYAVEFVVGSNTNKVKGGSNFAGLANVHPYNGWVSSSAGYNTTFQEFGTFAAPYNCGSANAMGVLFNLAGNNDGMAAKRVYGMNTRTGLWTMVNSDNTILLENVKGDYADTTVIAALNVIAKSVSMTSATTGQVSVYGTHWDTRFTSATAGFVDVLCNEPTASTAAQCWASGGVPQFNSSGAVLLTKVGDQVTWELPFFAKGYTAFSNTAPTITGTNVTFGTRWGNHDIEFQVNTGVGYGGTWLNLTAANLILATINATTGFKLKIRATCAIAATTNVITNMRVAMTTSTVAQETTYPLNVITLTLTGLVSGSDVTILSAGTETVLASQEEAAGSTYNFVYEATSNVDIAVYNPGYIPFFIRNYPLSLTDATLPCAQTPDPSKLT